MKKLTFILLITISGISYANEGKNETLTVVRDIRDKCDIIYENVYKDVYDHGGTAEEAKAIASAARCACREISTSIQ